MKLLGERRENKKFFRNNLEQFPALIVVVRGVHMPRGPQDLGEDCHTECSTERREKNLFGDTLFFSALLKKKIKTSTEIFMFLSFIHIHT